MNQYLLYPFPQPTSINRYILIHSLSLLRVNRSMGGKRQRKSSSFMSVFNIFRSNKHKGGHQYHDAYYEEGTRARKVWPSDEDRGRWGVAEPGIDIRAAAFIAQYKKKASESEIHCSQPQ